MEKGVETHVLHVLIEIVIESGIWIISAAGIVLKIKVKFKKGLKIIDLPIRVDRAIYYDRALVVLDPTRGFDSILALVYNVNLKKG